MSHGHAGHQNKNSRSCDDHVYLIQSPKKSTFTTGLIKMVVQAGAAPCLAAVMPDDLHPPFLDGLPPCPPDFGIQNKGKRLQAAVPAAKTCQLQRLSPKHRSKPPTSTCQLQSLTSSAVNTIADEVYRTQDLAVLSIILDPTSWTKLKNMHSSTQPDNFKYNAVKTIVLRLWNPCKVKLASGLHVHKKQGRFEFNAKSILRFVSDHRSNTKLRGKVLSAVRASTQKHCSKLPMIYRPVQQSTPLHVHWTRQQSLRRAESASDVGRMIFLRNVPSNGNEDQDDVQQSVAAENTAVTVVEGSKTIEEELVVAADTIVRCVYAYDRSHIHITCMHTHMHTHAYTHIIHAHTHACIHTCTHACTHAYMHTCTHT